ncbi:cytochrome P450 [Streptomyces sp. NPDC006879]|uniref:cytochrome P450 n=1 Tax=Streptomyces sp. NPDC006879 TaxID=3364767 RepID=UPI0036C3D18E
MSQAILRQILDYSSRSNPYPLYEELRRTPVSQFVDGPYVVSTYHEIQSLLHDPRISSEAQNTVTTAGDPLAQSEEEEEQATLPPSILRTDPPEHDRLRRRINRSFGPPHAPRLVHDMAADLENIIRELIDGIEDPSNFDLVERVAYPFPVTVICRLLGVPREDEARFHVWADTLTGSLDPDPEVDAEARHKVLQDARMQLGMYMAGLIEQRRKNPGEGMLSELASGHGPDGSLTTMELLSASVLLLIAGHETTVNLITNGMLTLLRNPELLRRLREDPSFAAPVVEELLRFEPPVHILPHRATLADVEVGGVVIPKGSSLWLLLASGNRDPQRFKDPERFDPDRADAQHLGFGSGVHSCFGAPIARLETQIALRELVRRLENPRLLEDPPPYRQSAVLRGPRHLPLACDGIRP